jgi:hypoxanthine-guanine phosphoribosyltransferase
LTNPTAEVQALRSSFQVDYYGFEVDDTWVVGYGLDVAEEFRELPYVAAFDPQAQR